MEMATSVLHLPLKFPAHSMVPDGLEALWLKSAGMPSDLVVNIAETGLHLHRFPLYSRSSKFAEIAEIDKHSGQTFVSLDELPGGLPAFLVVANFCYGLDVRLSPDNVAAVRCAAAFLRMDEASHSLQGGVKTLADFADQKLEQMLASVGDAMTVTRSCEALMPLADELGIVKRCVDAVAGAIVEKIGAGGDMSPLDTESIISLGLVMFSKMVEGLRAHGVPGPVASRLIEEYGKKWLPLHTDESEITKELCYEASKTLQTLVDLLPPLRRERGDAAAADSRHLMRLLKVAIRFGATTECREKIQDRAGSVLDHASLEDVLTLEPAELQALAEAFLFEENTRTLSAPMESLRAVAALVDGYLRRRVAKGMTVNSFYRLAMALPPESRASHDELFHAMMEFLRAGNKQLTDMERLGLCETVNPAKLSDAAAEQALRSDDVPIAYVAQILMAQKAKLVQQLNAKRAEDGSAEIAALKEENARLKEESEKARSKLNAAALSYTAVRAAMREENQALQTELVSMRMAYEELEQRLQGTPKVPVEISPTALALSPPTGARSTRHPTTTAPARNPVQVNVNPSLRQLVFKGPSRDPSSVPWAQGKAPGVGGFDQGTGDAREERDGGGIGRYKEPPNEHELEQAPNKGRLRRLARNGK